MGVVGVLRDRLWLRQPGLAGDRLGGLGSMVPERRKDLARLGMKFISSGSLATFLTGTLAGLIGP